MKIAISAQERESGCAVDPRFGRTRFFLVYDTVTRNFTPLSNHQNLNAAQGAGIQSAGTVVNAGCGAVITGHCGPKAFAALSRAGVEVYLVPQKDMTVAQAVERFDSGELTNAVSADVQGHW